METLTTNNQTHNDTGNGKCRSLRDAVISDSLVHRCVQSGMNEEEIIVALVNEKERLFQRILELELICPKKIIQSGKIYRWDCPTELLP